MGLTNISYFNQQGLYSLECKDSVFFLDDGSTAVYSLADGVNSKHLSKVGARAIQEELGSYFLQNPFSSGQVSPTTHSSNFQVRLSDAVPVP